MYGYPSSSHFSGIKKLFKKIVPDKVMHCQKEITPSNSLEKHISGKDFVDTLYVFMWIMLLDLSSQIS